VFTLPSIGLLTTPEIDRLLERACGIVEHGKSSLNHAQRLSASNSCQITRSSRLGTVPGD
jgi:hypothetical protein